MVLVRPVSVGFAVDVVNSWSPTVRGTAEDDSPYPALEELCTRHEVEFHKAVKDDTIAHLAEQLHQVFATAGALDALAVLVSQLDARVAIDGKGAGWRVPAEHWLRGAALAGLVEYARTDPRLERLGTCSAHRCIDAYLDATQASTKKYCSTTCQTRAKAAARRSRTR